jgi:hypothetical protein
MISMKNFCFGFMAATMFIVFVTLVLYPQYSDYGAYAQTYNWLTQIKSVGIQAAIEKNILNSRHFSDMSVGINKNLVNTREMDIFEITPSGIIVIRGGRDGQVVILIPEISGKDVVWKCIGGSEKAVTNECRKQ